MRTYTYLRCARLTAALALTLPSVFAADAPATAAAAPSAPTTTEEQTPAPSLESAIKVFQATPSAPTDTGNLSATTSMLRDWNSAQSQLSNLEGYFENNDYANAVRQARQYARQARSPEIKKLWENLVAALNAEQKTREAALNAKLDETLKSSAARLLAATKASEVDTISESLYALQDAMGNNYSPRSQRGRNRLSNAISFAQQWQDLLASVESGDTESARNQLRNLSSNSSSERLLTRSQITARGAALKIGSADVAEESAKAEAVIKRAAALALSATKPAQLDPVIEELGTLKESRNSYYDNRLQRVYSRIDNAVNFLGQWQNVLASVEANDLEDARTQLRNLASNGYSYRTLSRADILAYAAKLKVEGPSATDNILKDATLDNLADYRERLAFLNESASGRRSSEFYNAIGELDRLVTATAALKAGSAGDGRAALKGGSSSCGAPNAGTLQGSLNRLKSEWFARALPALTGLKDLPAAKDGETTLALVRRLADDAIAAGDWPRAHRLVLVEKDMQPDTAACAVREQTTGANPGTAIGSWLKGQLLEKAAQPVAAAALYREALKAGSPPKLEEQLIARLRQLATEFPDSAKEAR